MMPVERLVDDLLDARAHVLDPARGERLHHQAAQAGMVRRILLQHPVAMLRNTGSSMIFGP